MDIESKTEDKRLMTNASSSHDRRRSRRCKISMWVLGVLIALAILITILALTVFKAKRPVITVNSVSLQDVNASFDLAKLRVLINVTLFINLDIKNPNRVGFKYSESVAYLKYKDAEVGEAPIEKGDIGSKEMKPMNLTMKLMADRLLFDSDLYTQVRSGSVPLSTSVELTGKVQLLFKIKVKSYSTCNFNIDVMNRALQDLNCHYKTKL